jgi:hypothetical protein
MEFTMLKLLRLLVVLYGCVHRDLSALSMFGSAVIPNSIVQQFVDNLCDTSMRRAASLLDELLLIREGKLQLHHNDSRLLSRNEIDDNIAHICTS